LRARRAIRRIDTEVSRAARVGRKPHQKRDEAGAGVGHAVAWGVLLLSLCGRPSRRN